MSKSIAISLSVYFCSNCLPSACAITKLSIAPFDANRHKLSPYLIKNELQKLGVFTLGSCASSLSDSGIAPQAVLFAHHKKLCRRPSSRFANLCATKQTWRNQKWGPWADSPSRIAEMEMLEMALGDNRKRVVDGAAPYTRTFPVAGA